MDEQVNIPNNAEIDQALKEFEQKNQVEQVQKAVVADKDSELPKMDSWVIRLSGGAIKEQRQAEWVLLTFIIVIVGISLVLFFNIGKRSIPKTPPASALELLQQMPINTNH